LPLKCDQKIPAFYNSHRDALLVQKLMLILFHDIDCLIIKGGSAYSVAEYKQRMMEVNCFLQQLIIRDVEKDVHNLSEIRDL